jgi:endonuclease/exonuclease/phosphatase (EEP) superfamily protein YafD
MADTPDQASPVMASWRKGLLKRARVLAVLSLLGLLIPLVARLPLENPDLVWLLDTAGHGQWFYLVGLAVFGTIAGILDRHWLILMMALPLPWLTAAETLASAQGEGPGFSLISANVHFENRDPARLLKWINQRRPDVVILLEIAPGFTQSLTLDMDAYPHRQLLPEHSPFGIGLFSRIPFRAISVDYGTDGIPRIDAELPWQDRQITLVAFHPMPPLTAAYRSTRDRKLLSLATMATASANPTLIAGDFNTSPWSRAFSGLAETGMKSAGGITPTWPAILQGIMGIPMDLVVASKHWARVDHETGPDIGSDHLPVFTRLQMVESVGGGR